MAESERRRSYFHPSKGWNDSPEGAVLRADSQVRFEEKGAAQTLLYRRDADGAWSIVLDSEEMDGTERALVWQTWKSRAAGRDLLAFRGLRAIDSETASLLSGLQPYSLDGEPLAEPTDAGFLFLLSDRDAREFSRRVMKDQKGMVEMAVATDGRPEQLIETLRKEAAVIERARKLDADALQRGREGDFSGLPAFHARTDQFRERFLLISQLCSELQLAVAHLRGQERTDEERIGAEELLREAKRIRLAAQAERASRDEEAAELDYRQAVALGKARPVPERLRRSAALEVGIAARRAGFAVEETADGVQITLADGQVLTLGPGFELS